MSLVVALGHSDSNFEDAIGCVEAGASVFTHTFNGMNSLSQHSPTNYWCCFFFTFNNR